MRSANIKILLLAIAVLIVIGTLVYTQRLVEEFLQKEREIAALYVKSLEFIANSPTGPTDYSFVFDEVIRSIDFPMILTDASNQPLPPYHTNARNITIDTSLTDDEQRAYLEHVIQTLDAQNPPISVSLRVGDTDVIVQHLHYGESAIVTRLRWLPYVEIGVAGLFILIAYVGFNYIKRSEQSNIWVGMSKETAHQLGTPLSSLMGWAELLKEQAANDPKQLGTIAEIESDIQRLQRVTDRFSKIGSKPMLKEENLNEVIESVIQYFRKRLPSRFANGSIDIRIEPGVDVTLPLNRELFGWVIENLVKNALDAMEDSSGKIAFSIHTRGNAVLIDVKDTGKGIDMKHRKDIFRPGYSTKQRGWGLGLSLSKRIVETYHKGKLFVKESRPGKGTTFRIRLRK
jgi:signal transduction histidine kinase